MQAGDDPARLRTETCDVAETDNVLDTFPLDFRKNSVERDKVAVDVSNDRDAGGDPSQPLPLSVFKSR